MLFRRTPKRHQPAPSAANSDRPSLSPLDVVFTYHEETKHYLHRFARSLGYMDWNSQPDPFRRYQGAPIVPLDQVPISPGPPYGDLFQPGRIAPQTCDRYLVSQLLYDSLALSAWKEFQGYRWSLRVNPSSGNLHPTEGYLISGPVPGLLDTAAVCHYAPYEHRLEVRRLLTDGQWSTLAEQLPAGTMLIGLTSIYWRESWKYGERAFRYCQHDVGHAIGAITMAAGVLGWQTRLLMTVTDDELSMLLGIHQQLDGSPVDLDPLEAEHPACLLALYPGTSQFPSQQQGAFFVPDSLVAELAAESPAGTPNRLSPDHHHWSIIDQVAGATQRRQSPSGNFRQAPPRAEPTGQPTAGGSSILPSGNSMPARQVIRQRRSAVAMDGITAIGRETFYGILRQSLPGHPPFQALPWRPSLHLVTFVHRVHQHIPGLYILVRDPAQQDLLRAALDTNFQWHRPPDCPADLEVFLLREGDHRAIAQAVSCNQEIAGHGAFAVGMLAAYRDPIQKQGPWFYRALHWEAGLIGQALYLAAEAAGLQATGIGCFFDDLMHQVLGLAGYSAPGEPDTRYQILYHFTVGSPVHDHRLRTLDAYQHLGEQANQQIGE